MILTAVSSNEEKRKIILNQTKAKLKVKQKRKDFHLLSYHFISFSLL